MRIRTQCRSCGLPFKDELEKGKTTLACPACDVERTVAQEKWSRKDRTVTVCPLCDCTHFYKQRDIHRAWGCLLVIVGAIFVPWTYGLSLIGLSLVDLWLHYKLPEAVVCYRCDTVYRDARPHKGQGEFDLLKHDVLKFGKEQALRDARVHGKTSPAAQPLEEEAESN